MSGITITDTDTATPLPSACGGTVFTLGVNPDSFTVAGGNGTDCGDSFVRNYDPVGPTPLGPGPQTISIDRDENPFFDQDYPGAAAVNIAAAPYNLGGPWTQTTAVTDFATDGAGAMNLQGLGTAQYVDLADAPPNPDMDVSFFCHADPGYSDTIRIYARYNNGTDTGYYLEIDPTSTMTLGKRIAGVDTILNSAPFVMPALVDPVTVFHCIVIGTAIRARQPGGPDFTVTDATIAPAGNMAIKGTRAVGQPVKITEITAFPT